ncbi:MAG: hypothetical protein HZB41_11775 [Ignavibacteriae bacterium]|nr:hypothetical protein [Ignavibacteriota bacterium]
MKNFSSFYIYLSVFILASFIHQIASAQYLLSVNKLPSWLTQENTIEKKLESPIEMAPRNANPMSGEYYQKAIEHLKNMPDENINSKNKNAQIQSITQWQSITATRVPLKDNPNIAAHGRIRTLYWFLNSSNPSGSIWESYIGASSGGIWKKSWNRPDSWWYSYGDKLPNPSVGALCVYHDYIRGDVIYAGTGDWERFNGAGLFMSTDQGSSWNKIPLMDGTNEVIPTAITSIIRKENYGSPDTMYVATDMGFFRSAYGGTTGFTRIPIVAEPNWGIFAMVKNPVSQNILYASLPYRGIYKTTNWGSTWFPVNNGLPDMSKTGRTMSLAISQSNPQVLYVAVTDTNSDIQGVFITTNGGDIWTRTNAPNDISIAGQAFHANAIAVHPSDWRIAYVGSVNCYITRNAGQNWDRIDPGHSDITGFYFLPNNPNTVIITSDGGVFIRDDSRNTIQNTSENFSGGVPLQEYGMDYAVSEPNMMIAGTQDNGTMVSTTASVSSTKNWTEFYGCDGANYVYIDPVNSNYAYFNSWCGETNPRFRTPNKGINVDDINSGLAMVYYSPIGMNKFNTNYIFTYTNQAVYFSSNRGNDWRRINNLSMDFTAGQFPKEAPAGLAVSNGAGTNPVLYVCFWKPKPSDVIPSEPNPERKIFVSEGVPGSMINRISYLPDLSTVRAVIADNWNPNIAYAFPEAPVFKLFKTSDRGLTWNNISGSRPDSSLPPANVNYAVSVPGDANTIFAGTDVGMFKTSNNGSTWQKYQYGLPIVPINNIVYIPTAGNDLLKIGTFGRGFWERIIDGDDPNWTPAPTVIRRENRCPDSLIYCRLYWSIIHLRALDNPVWRIPPGCFMVANGQGTIERSFDAGQTWEMFQLPTKENITSIAPLSESGAFAVGEEGGMFITKDYGQTWNQVQTQYNVPLLSVAFSSFNDGYIVGQDGLLLRSNDGGNSWSEFMNDPVKTFSQIYFVNSGLGFIAGMDNKSKPATPFMLRTNDGGKSW